MKLGPGIWIDGTAIWEAPVSPTATATATAVHETWHGGDGQVALDKCPDLCLGMYRTVYSIQSTVFVGNLFG